jgi:hypothetical protein
MRKSKFSEVQIFEFHGLLQRKVVARFDGGNITSDAAVLLLREVEKRTGDSGGDGGMFYRPPRSGGNRAH